MCTCLLTTRCTEQSKYHYCQFRRVVDVQRQDKESLVYGSGGMVQDVEDQLLKARYLIQPILTTIDVRGHWPEKKALPGYVTQYDSELLGLPSRFRL